LSNWFFIFLISSFSIFFSIIGFLFAIIFSFFPNQGGFGKWIGDYRPNKKTCFIVSPIFQKIELN
jgi:predicted membrane protein